MLFANRGMFLEELVNRALAVYANAGLALLEKRMPAVRIVDVREGGTVTAILAGGAKTDYFGVWGGRHLDFEAKQTSKAHFALASLSKEQAAHLRAVAAHGGCCFVLVLLETSDEIFMVTFAQIEAMKAARKGRLTAEWLRENAVRVPIAPPGIADFLPAVQQKFPPFGGNRSL